MESENLLRWQSDLESFNRANEKRQQRNYKHCLSYLEEQGLEIKAVFDLLDQVQVAIPSWALGTGGTRFGRFPGPGEPRSLEDKIEDVALLSQLSRGTKSISLHLPWDKVNDPQGIKEKAQSLGIEFDAVNSNTFQDQPGQAQSYKFGSLCNSLTEVRQQAIEHNLEVIRIGEALGSQILSVWLADGSCFPGQQDFRASFERTAESLKTIHQALPKGWRMFTEHKPFEPNFYSSVVNDWGSSLLLATEAGPNCQCLVDLGHHLPNTNIEQVVSRLAMVGRLGGFHFNDSKYADDDLTTGSIKPYQLFLIMDEIISSWKAGKLSLEKMAWMIDASHNVKDPLEDLLQSLEAIQLALVQALCVPREKLKKAQDSNDVVATQNILQNAFRSDWRPLLSEFRRLRGGAIDTLDAYRHLEVRKTLAKQRGKVQAAGVF